MAKVFLKILFYSLILAAGLFFVKPALAAYEKVAPGEEVTISEFVYNDNFTPNASSCTILVYYPSGASFTLPGGNTMNVVTSTGRHYKVFTPDNIVGVWSTIMSCGTEGEDLTRLDKTFVVGYVNASTTAIASSVWNNNARTLSDFGSLASDVWNVATSTFSTAGSVGKHLATNLNAAISNVAAAVWNVLTTTLTTDGSIGKQFVTNIDTTLSSRASQVSLENASSSLAVLILNNKALIQNLNNISATSVWSVATRSLTDYSTSTIAAGVWANTARTLTNYGNNITASDVWNVLASTLISDGSIGKQLATNIDATMSSRASQVSLENASSSLAVLILNNKALIQNLNNISATSVWNYGTKNVSLADPKQIWDVASSTLSMSGSVGKQMVDNLNATISSRGISNLTAADVWSAATRTMTDYSTSTIAAAVWANTARTLSSYGNDITAADVWNILSSGLITDGSIGKQLTTNVDVTVSSRASQASLNNASSSLAILVLNNKALIQNLNNISATSVWNYGTKNVSLADPKQVWDVASSTLATSGSVGKQMVDNLNATISSRGISNLTAADVWTAATRSLTDYSTSTISAAVWTNAARTLTNYGNDITAADVWNVLSLSLITDGSIGKQLATNIDATLTSRASQASLNNTSSSLAVLILNNKALIQNLNDISAADVWGYSTKNVSLSDPKQIWDVASSTLATSGSVGKQMVDNLNATISSRGVSNLSATDVWTAATRSLTDYSTSTIALAVWANAARTLTNYGNDITAADVWNVLTSSLTTIGSVGEKVNTNLNNPISSLATLSIQQAGWTVTMSNADRILAGNTYRAKIYLTNYQSSPTNSFASPKVSLYDSSRNLVVSNISMTNLSPGVYEYVYSIPAAAAQGFWESIVNTEVESGKTIQSNDYWTVEGSPAQVIINSITDDTTPSIAANVTITNEGLTGYEYHYEWCVVTNASNACGGGDDTYYATASKYVNSGADWNTNLSATIYSVGNYYFKLIVYYGTEQSGSSRYFSAQVPISGPVCGDSICASPEYCTTCPADCGVCSNNTGNGGGGGGGGAGAGSPTPNTPVSNPIVAPVPAPVQTSTPAEKPEPVATACSGADFNKDKKVNSVDFSILLAFWKGAWPFKNSCVDINLDKKVNSVDFSILMYQWGKKK